MIDTLDEAQSKDPSRKCFRLIGGVLVEQTVKDVLPALQTNDQGVSSRSPPFPLPPPNRALAMTSDRTTSWRSALKLKKMLDMLVKQYADKEKELQAFVREHGLVNAS